MTKVAEHFPTFITFNRLLIYSHFKRAVVPQAATVHFNQIAESYSC